MVNEYLEKQLNAYSDYSKILDTEDITMVGNIINIEEYFYSIKHPVIINDLPNESKKMETINEYLCDTVDRSMLIVSCKCGKYRGNYYEGITCEECGSKISNNIIENLENEVWIKIPDGIGKVLNPIIYLTISRSLSFGNKNLQSYLDFVLNPNEIPNTNVLSLMDQYFNDFGFRYLYENFDYVMDIFINRFPKTKNKKNVKLLPIFIEKYRDRLFTGYIPIVSKFLQPTIFKRHTEKRYIDGSLKNILKSVISLSMIRHGSLIKPSSKNMERSMWKVYSTYIKYYFDLIKNKFSVKNSYFRKNLFGVRLHYTFRNVISPITSIAQADEIHIPWKTGLTVFYHHLLNILSKRMGYTLVEAHDIVNQAYVKYNPVIDQIFQLLILESPFKGIPVLQNRNPSLITSNILLHFITKVNPEFTTISERFIKNFGRLDENNHNDPTGKLHYQLDEIFVSKKSIVKENDFDTPEAIPSMNDYTSLTNHNGEIRKSSPNDILNTFDDNQLSYLINNNAVQVHYLHAKMMNLDYDGDHLNFALVLENAMAYYMLDRIHPSNFMVGTGKLEIRPRVHIPKQSLTGLNDWLEKGEDR